MWHSWQQSACLLHIYPELWVNFPDCSVWQFEFDSFAMACLINSGNLPSIQQNKVELRPNARGREDRSVRETTECAVPAPVSRAHPFTEVSDGASRRILPVAGHHVTLFLRCIVEPLPWARNHWDGRDTTLKERIKNPWLSWTFLSGGGGGRILSGRTSRMSPG